MTDARDLGDEPFAALARAAREPVLIHERGLMREINEAFTRLLGYERHEVLGKGAVETLVSPESHAAVRASMAREGPGGTGEQEIVLLTRSGERRLVLSVSEPVRYQGRPMRLVTMQDVTERAELQAANRRIATLLRAIVDNTDQLVFVKEVTGRMLLTNRPWREAYGVSDPIGRVDAEFLPEHLVAAIRAADRRVLEKVEAMVLEQVVPTARGVRTYLTNKFPLVDESGAAYAIGGISTDITQRRGSTDLLAAVSRETLGTVGNDFFEALVRALATSLVADMAFVGELEPGRECVRSLASWRDGRAGEPFSFVLAGSPTESVLAHKIAVHADGLATLFPDDPTIVRAGRQGYVGVPVIGSDGVPRGVVAVLFNRALRPDDDRFVLEAAPAAMEVFAARAAAELERLDAVRTQEELRDVLERRVADRTVELRAINEELEAFAYTVSHDLRAPLRHINGFGALLEKSTDGVLGPDGKHQLDTIRRASQRMGSLIDDLLSFSRTGRSTMKPLRFSMADLVDEVVREHEEVPGVVWTVGPLPQVEGDRPLLRQVLRNLVDNALKYTRGRSPPRVTVSADDDAREWRFHLADNGVGFDPRYAEQLFGVFRRLHRAGEFEGNGIGLATVRRILSRHGGRIWASARLGEGATFSFSLPKHGKEASPR